MASGNFFGGEFFGGGFFGVNGPPLTTAPTSGGTAGGRSGGKRYTSQQYLRARQRREEDEVALILKSVMPIISAGVQDDREIFLQSMSLIDDEVNAGRKPQ